MKKSCRFPTFSVRLCVGILRKVVPRRDFTEPPFGPGKAAWGGAEPLPFRLPMGDSIHSKKRKHKKAVPRRAFFLKVILQGMQNPLNPCRHQYCHILGRKQVERCWKWLLRLYQFVKTWKKQSVWTQRACNKAERLTQGHFIPKLLCCSWMVLRDFRNMFAGAAETKSCNIVFRFSLNFERLLSVPNPKVNCKCLFSHALNWSLARRKLYQLPNKCS